MDLQSLQTAIQEEIMRCILESERYANLESSIASDGGVIKIDVKLDIANCLQQSTPATETWGNEGGNPLDRKVPLMLPAPSFPSIAWTDQDLKFMRAFKISPED